MIVPTRRCVMLLGAGFPLALLPVLVQRWLWPVWAGFLALSLALLATERLLGPTGALLNLEAHLPAVLYIGDRDTLILRIWGPRKTELQLLCDLDPGLEVQPLARVSLKDGTGEVRIPLVPRRRGTAHISSVWLRWTGPLGLLEWKEQRDLMRRVDVVPNTRLVRGAALHFFARREFLAGLKVEKYLGDGSEFESLREHSQGLDSRSIDWKASARHHKLLSREYRAERNHPVIVALDTGYLMSEPLEGIPKLDHAINAALLLSYVALKTGDRVGLFAFDERVRLFDEPRGGVGSLHRLQRHTARLSYSHAETNFTLGLVELDRHLRRRGLVIVLTDFLDNVTAELMVENLERLGRNHLVVFVTLRDVTTDRLAAEEPLGTDELNRAMTASDLLREREIVMSKLKRRGIHTIDAAPSYISTRLIDRYLHIKRRELA